MKVFNNLLTENNDVGLMLWGLNIDIRNATTTKK